MKSLSYDKEPSRPHRAFQTSHSFSCLIQFSRPHRAFQVKQSISCYTEPSRPHRA
jgi:hypothetical protein